MHLEVDYVPGRDQYFWNICDGPDGIDHGEGIGTSLGEVMEQVVIWRRNNAQEYR